MANKLLTIGIPSPANEQAMEKIVGSPEITSVNLGRYFKKAFTWMAENLHDIEVKQALQLSYWVTVVINDLSEEMRGRLEEKLKEPNPNPFDMTVREFTEEELESMLEHC